MKRKDILPYLVLFLLLSNASSQADEIQLIQVRRGDTVSYLCYKIYGAYDLRIAEMLRAENPQVEDLDLIYAGQHLRFPPAEAMKRRLVLKPMPAPPPPVQTSKEPAQKEIFMQARTNKAVLTFLEGQVQVKKGGEGNWSPARPNSILSEKDQIRVAAKSRAELILDNQSVMRLSENTVLSLQKLEEERASQKDTTKVNLLAGKLWTRTAKLFNPASRYDVQTPTAIAGVQGTVYQINVGDDRSTTIQVYQGAVNVYNPFPEATGQVPRSSAPHEVSGPQEVAGPTAISREEWTKIVLHQFQQITITGRGLPRSTSFDVNQERRQEWIRWNEERDRDFQPPPRFD